MHILILISKHQCILTFFVDNPSLKLKDIAKDYNISGLKDRYHNPISLDSDFASVQALNPLYFDVFIHKEVTVEFLYEQKVIFSKLVPSSTKFIELRPEITKAFADVTEITDEMLIQSRVNFGIKDSEDFTNKFSCVDQTGKKVSLNILTRSKISLTDRYDLESAAVIVIDDEIEKMDNFFYSQDVRAIYKKGDDFVEVKKPFKFGFEENLYYEKNFYIEFETKDSRFEQIYNKRPYNRTKFKIERHASQSEHFEAFFKEYPTFPKEETEFEISKKEANLIVYNLISKRHTEDKLFYILNLSKWAWAENVDKIEKYQDYSYQTLYFEEPNEKSMEVKMPLIIYAMPSNPEAEIFYSPTKFKDYSSIHAVEDFQKVKVNLNKKMYEIIHELIKDQNYIFVDYHTKKRISNHDYLYEYFITTSHFVLVSEFQLFVKLPTKSTIVLDCISSNTVGDILAKIYDKTGYKTFRSSLYYYAKALKHPSTLDDYNIKAEYTLALAYKGVSKDDVYQGTRGFSVNKYSQYSYYNEPQLNKGLGIFEIRGKTFTDEENDKIKLRIAEIKDCVYSYSILAENQKKRIFTYVSSKEKITRNTFNLVYNKKYKYFGVISFILNLRAKDDDTMVRNFAGECLLCLKPKAKESEKNAKFRCNHYFHKICIENANKYSSADLPQSDCLICSLGVTIRFF